MKDGRPFGIGGLWENWKDPFSGEWIRTLVIITTDANELVAQNPQPNATDPFVERLRPLAQRRS
jgi:hypothetical protein